MRNLIYLIITTTILFSCSESKTQGEQSLKNIDFEVFSIKVPVDWMKLDIKGMDSYVGGIETVEKDTVLFDYGKNTYIMDNTIKVNDIKEYKELDSIGFEMSDLIFSRHPFIDQNQGTFHNEYYYYEKVGNYKPKISVPKISGKGLTAILFDSLPNGNMLYLYAKNLNKKEQEILLESFKTIKIK